MFAAFLDTSVLQPSLQRDFLLSLAAEGLYRPLWSEAVLAELTSHEGKKLTSQGVPDAVALAERLVDRMRDAFDAALITGWEPLEGSHGLPDPNDSGPAGGDGWGDAVPAAAVTSENRR